MNKFDMILLLSAQILHTVAIRVPENFFGFIALFFLQDLIEIQAQRY